MGLHVVQDRAAAGPVQADRGSGGLRVSAGRPGELDAHVAQHAARILRLGSPVDRPLGGQHPRRHALQARHRGPPEDAQAGPAAGPAQADGRGTAQHHGGLAGALGDDPAARLDDDRGVAAPGPQGRARLDRERGAVVHEQLVAEVVDRVATQGEVAANLAVETAARARGVGPRGAAGALRRRGGGAGRCPRGAFARRFGGVAGASGRHRPGPGAGGDRGRARAARGSPARPVR